MDELLPTPTLLTVDNGCRFTVEAVHHDDIVVTVVGDLDPASARVLQEIVEAAIGARNSNRGVEVDLRRLRACSNSGVRALTTCAGLGARLRDGLHFRVGHVVASNAGDGD